MLIRNSNSKLFYNLSVMRMSLDALTEVVYPLRSDAMKFLIVAQDLTRKIVTWFSSKKTSIEKSFLRFKAKETKQKSQLI